MASSVPAHSARNATPLSRLPQVAGQERAVLQVLVDHHGRVLSRRELARLAGMTDLSDRRCDSVIVDIRRRLGAAAVRTVRGRGWMLDAGYVAVATGLLGER